MKRWDGWIDRGIARQVIDLTICELSDSTVHESLESIPTVRFWFHQISISILLLTSRLTAHWSLESGIYSDKTILSDFDLPLTCHNPKYVDTSEAL